MRLHLFGVAAIYTAVYGWLLVWSGGLPYVMDNNESFSSLWHAANLFQFPLTQSAGLADEAFSPAAPAHPYVHTHQGNFPRLFALLIYVLGARTIESQIILTTATAGLGSILVVGAFFGRIATPTFGVLAAVTLMTDYVLFAQWHVVTYRVWYCLLLFACLYSVHRAADDPSRRWFATTAASFACLFYFELVFAAFVAAFCGLYLLLRQPVSLQRLLRVGLAMGLGSAAGLAVVVAQAVAYLGWDDFRRDIYLTFVARNDIARDPSLLEEAARFFESRGVIFWHNVQDRASFSGLLPFVRSVTSFDWRIHTPMLAIAAWALSTGWLISLLNLGRSWRRVLIPVPFLVAFASMPALQGALFGETFSPAWEELQGSAGPRVLLYVVVGAAALIGAYLAYAGAERVLGVDPRMQLRGVLIYLAGGALAYSIVYTLSPGYIYSGYLSRHAPFTVFLTDVLIAVALYVLFKTSSRLYSLSQLEEGRSWFGSYALASLAGVSVLLAAFLPIYWLLVQVQYVKWMPPTHYAFLKKLAEPPYKGASFVVNNYAAPVAAYTGQWAYFDPAISQAYWVWRDDRIHLAGDRKYLWFADRDTNPEYRKPDYFLCMIPQSPSTLVNRILHQRGVGPGEPGCSQLALVKLAALASSGGNASETPPGVKLVDYDRAGFEANGFDSWAIVKLEWSDGPGGMVLDWNVDPIRKRDANLR